tara:strand:+ start:25422 stop:25652 length:231 start_codon:yes stop_codon:yes gene_type:complete
MIGKGLLATIEESANVVTYKPGKLDMDALVDLVVGTTGVPEVVEERKCKTFGTVTDSNYRPFHCKNKKCKHCNAKK